MDKPPPSQADKFKQAAREHECDEDEGRWDERLRKIASQKPAPAPDATKPPKRKKAPPPPKE